MDYCFNGGCWGAVFAVPDSVVDNFIKLAGESALKVLLYVLRHSGKRFSAGEIASALNMKESQVEEAFIFWENANVLAKQENRESAPSKPAAKASAKKELPPWRAQNLKPTDIADRINSSGDIRAMFEMAEKVFGRTLNYTEQNRLILLHEGLGLSADVLVTIAAYCISIDRGSINSIEKYAVSCSERGINTLELVQEEIRNQEEKNSFTGKIMKLFYMKRRPTSNQQEFVDSWQAKGYSLELIGYAYEKTIETIDKLNFSYINKILENWYANGLITKAKIDESENSRKKNKKNESEHSYDLDEYKALVNNFGDE